jgi:hypothetical protein
VLLKVTSFALFIRIVSSQARISIADLRGEPPLNSEFSSLISAGYSKPSFANDFS